MVKKLSVDCAEHLRWSRAKFTVASAGNAERSPMARILQHREHQEHDDRASTSPVKKPSMHSSEDTTIYSVVQPSGNQEDVDIGRCYYLCSLRGNSRSDLDGSRFAVKRKYVRVKDLSLYEAFFSFALSRSALASALFLMLTCIFLLNSSSVPLIVPRTPIIALAIRA